MTSITAILEDRDLTKDERSLVEWLLDHGTPDAIRYRPHLNKARVAARCYCGCARIDFGIDGVVPNKGEPIFILSDYEWIDTDGRLFGTFVFSRCDLLAGLEVWLQDGLATADYLPEISQLLLIGGGTERGRSSISDMIAEPGGQRERSTAALPLTFGADKCTAMYGSFGVQTMNSGRRSMTST